MKKILITNNEYQKIMRKEADLFWKKVFEKSDAGIKDGELDKLKKQYWDEMESNLSIYEIEKFNPGVKNKEIEKLIEGCTSNTIKDHYTLYRGFTGLSYINIDGMERLFDTGYQQVLISGSDLTIIEYVEGDLYIKVYNSKEFYSQGLEQITKFYNSL